MNLTLLKNYAPVARKAFIEAVTRRAGVVGVHPDRVEPVTESGDVALIGGQPFPRSIVSLRKQLLEIIQRDGFSATMEAMAYTWFNRLVALRFMELHDGWLSHGYRVLSHPDGHSLPEIIQHAEHLDLKSLDRDEVVRLKLAGNRDEELYRILLLAQCAELNRILPDVFSRLDDSTILLLPDNLLHSDSLVRQLVANSSEEDWKEVEVLGWLYQFYISEKKDSVMARKSAVPTEDIPAVTQLFTPHWIVRYLVENSLGRLWLLNRPGSRLREHMPYYIEGEAETDFLKITKPEEIRLCDPAVGSGHMLTYAFDLLTLIYEEEGYAPTEIPALILRHNLHGLEICPRAAQLAELALVFKAREKSRRFFQPEHLVRPHIIELRDVRFAENELRDYIHALGLGDLFNQPVLRLLHQFEEAKNFGSLIQPCLDERAIADVRRAIEAKDLGGQLFLRETHLKVLRVLEQAEALTQRYHVVVANPPYMGSGNFNPSLRIGLENNFKVTRTDLYAIFLERSFTFVLKGGAVAMVTMQSWMFTTSYRDLRAALLKNFRLDSMAHLGTRAFGSISGEVVSTTAFVFINEAPTSVTTGRYLRLVDGGEEDKHQALLQRSNLHRFEQHLFSGVPASPVIYWKGTQLVELFQRLPSVGDIAPFREGIHTGNNERYLRLWWEPTWRRVILSANGYKAIDDAGASWVPYNKGGDFTRWYGNNYVVIAFDRTARDEMEAIKGHVRPSQSLYFKAGGTWADIGSRGLGMKFYPDGYLFDGAGPVVVGGDDNVLLIGGVNSCAFGYLCELLMPNIHYKCGTVKRVPFPPHVDREKAVALSQDAINSARADWDNFETSWDFRDQPLLRAGLKGATLEASWRNWEAQSTAAIRRMQELETENNRLFIAAYGLDGELQPEVPEAQITLVRADAKKDMTAFLSYAVGCMMGRYSPDLPGLILANAGDTLREFLEKVGKLLAELTFAPDEDGIIPVLDGEWFEDDIVARTRDFLRATFGEATLAENLRFIEESVGKDLRSYFLTDFYKDHLQTYKNRPIYWLFSSGKQRAFQCLVYLHRYQEGTLARIRTEYVIPLQGKLSALITRLGGDPDKGGQGGEVAAAATSSARKKLQTELDKAKKQMAELLAYDEQLRSYADQRIALDLDDGVKVNYAKFGPLVAETKKICGTKDD